MRRARHADGRCDVRHEQARRVRTPEVTRIRLEIGRGRVERDRDVGRLLDREPARPRVEGIEGRRPVLVEELLGRGERHEHRLDLTRHETRVERPHQRGRARDVRARHRRPLDRLEELVVRVGQRDRVGCVAGEDLHAGRRDVGLARAQQLERATARAERSHQVGDTTLGPSASEARGDAGMRVEEIQDLDPRVVLEMNRGNRVAVGSQSLQRHVVEDHPEAAPLRDVEALLEACVHAAPAEDHPSEEDPVRGCALTIGVPENGRVEERDLRVDSSGHARAPDLQPGTIAALEHEGARELPLLRARCDRRHPGPAVDDGLGGGPIVARRGGDEDARRIRVEEGELRRLRVGGGAPVDREVDHVDAVEDRLVHGRGGVALEAAVLTAHLVGDHVRAGRDAGDRAAVDAEQRRRHLAVPGGGARGVRSVAIVVAGRGEGRRGHRAVAGSDARVVRGEEAVRADHLVVACERGSWVRADPELTCGEDARRGVGIPGRIRIRERRVLGPDAGIEHAHDDSFAGGTLPAEVRARPSMRRAGPATRARKRSHARGVDRV
jgi:hypothetical protein